jgi:GTP-binding protein
MVDKYLAQRAELALVLLLVDSRRDPDDAEREFAAWLEVHHRPVGVVATKLDKLSRSERTPRLRRIAEALRLPTEDVTGFSAMTKEGKRELWAKIDAFRRAHSIPSGTATDNPS